MARKKKTKKAEPKKRVVIKKEEEENEEKESFFHELRLHPETKKSIWAIAFLGTAIILFLASFQNAGPFGAFLYKIFGNLFGVGYYLLPVTFLIMAGVFFTSERTRIYAPTFIGALLFVLSGLGLIDVLDSGKGGLLGKILGSLEIPFGYVASIVVLILLIVVSLLVTLNLPIKFRRKEKTEEEEMENEENETGEEQDEEAAVAETSADKEEKPAKEQKEEDSAIKETISAAFGIIPKKSLKMRAGNYVFPPLDLLKSSVEKPTSGDLRANANIIKRTLDGFGIPVEMGEVSIGPKVTRYTLKPAEGVKLSRITALSQDLALALAAHPIRIEAPIPGKSLVGIEVPNKAAAVVRLGSLMNYPDFTEKGLLSFALGRDVTGEPLFPNIEKMPHMLVAGSTGSGKSVTVHSIIISLLYKNSPDTLRFLMIDPKRVELSIYSGIPHLIAPVVTESKKALAVFKWAIKEMERRYEILLQAGSRDIQSYNKKKKDDTLPYIVIIVDELADLMSTYGRDVEGFIVRLAQMARATGIHLILSTQRPSVEVITGLIKANITARIALQVASQIDSRTILDTSGAEKLLGGGDMLFTSAELSKPRRIQGSYISEEEINKVATFIREHNTDIVPEDGDAPALEIAADSKHDSGAIKSADIFDGLENDDDQNDEMLDEAIQVVVDAQKASASLLQRRLKVGYARAARLLDIMEARGIIGAGDGAKAREVFMEKPVE